MKILELKNIISEIKNSVDYSKRRLAITEKIIDEFECSSIEVIQTEVQKKNIFLKNKQNMNYLWNSIKQPKTHVIAVPEGKKRKHWAENIVKEIRTKIFLKLISTHRSRKLSETQAGLKTNKTTPGNLRKLLKTKDERKTSKATRV